jgi:hypothetical protein
MRAAQIDNLPMPVRLIIIFVPGLTLSVLERAPLKADCSIALVPVEPVNATSHEVTCLTGLLPDYHGAMTRGSLPEKLAFWTRAQARRSVAMAACPFEAIEHTQGDLLISHALAAQVALKLDALKKLGALCVIGTPQDSRALNEPSERPVLLGWGFNHDRVLIGACEVAGLLDRLLTGVTVSDR